MRVLKALLILLVLVERYCRCGEVLIKAMIGCNHLHWSKLLTEHVSSTHLEVIVP